MLSFYFTSAGAARGSELRGAAIWHGSLLAAEAAIGSYLLAEWGTYDARCGDHILWSLFGC